MPSTPRRRPVRVTGCHGVGWGQLLTACHYPVDAELGNIPERISQAVAVELFRQTHHTPDAAAMLLQLINSSQLAKFDLTPATAKRVRRRAKHLADSERGGVKGRLVFRPTDPFVLVQIFPPATREQKQQVRKLGRRASLPSVRDNVDGDMTQLERQCAYVRGRRFQRMVGTPAGKLYADFVMHKGSLATLAGTLFDPSECANALAELDPSAKTTDASAQVYVEPTDTH